MGILEYDQREDTWGCDVIRASFVPVNYKVDVGRTAHLASPIRFDSLGLIHGPYTLPAGNPIGSSPSVKFQSFFKEFVNTSMPTDRFLPLSYVCRKQ